MTIAIIVAFEKNRGIGKDGRIVWDFPSDRAYYKTMTLGNFVIFGRKTFEEFGKPLPGRVNIVVSGTKNFEGENLYTVQSLKEAIELAERINSGRKKALTANENNLPAQKPPFRPQILLPQPQIFLCGGQKIYSEGIPLAETIYTTQIEAAYPCDAFFPQLPKGVFSETDRSSIMENGVKLNFITYTKE